MIFLKDIFFPKFCLGCGFIGVYICNRCRQRLHYVVKDSCLYCGKTSLFGLTHPGCLRKNGLAGNLSIFYYNDFLKKIIKNIKYRQATEVLKELFNIIDTGCLNKLSFYKKINQEFLLQPIPLHQKKLLERGFNQSERIAGYFSRFIKFPMINSLIRKKATQPQAQIKIQHGRYLNIKNAFGVINKNKVKDRNIILIDDVLTTGLTVKEAARELMVNGAKRAFTLTLAKG